MSTPMIPTTYDEWRHCITVECGIALTRDYISDRLKALNDAGDYGTQRLLAVYGPQHFQRVVHWFEQAAQASDTSRPSSYTG